MKQAPGKVFIGEVEGMVLLGAMPGYHVPLCRDPLGWFVDRKDNPFYVEFTVETLQQRGLLDGLGRLTETGWEEVNRLFFGKGAIRA